MHTGSSQTLIGWKSGKANFAPLWKRMEGAWVGIDSEELSPPMGKTNPSDQSADANSPTI